MGRYPTFKCDNCGATVPHKPYHAPCYGAVRCQCGALVKTNYNPATNYRHSQTIFEMAEVKEHLGKYWTGGKVWELSPEEKRQCTDLEYVGDLIYVGHYKGKTIAEKVATLIVETAMRCLDLVEDNLRVSEEFGYYCVEYGFYKKLDKKPTEEDTRRIKEKLLQSALERRLREDVSVQKAVTEELIKETVEWIWSKVRSSSLPGLTGEDKKS